MRKSILAKYLSAAALSMAALTASGTKFAFDGSGVAAIAQQSQPFVVSVSNIGVALTAPVQTAASTSASGGTLDAATYYYVVVALNARGTTQKSNEVSITTSGSTSSNTVNWGAVSGATGYRIYRGVAAATQTLYYTVGAVTTYLDTGAASTAGTPPTTNTTAAVDVANVDIWGAWEYENNAGFDSSGTLTVANVVISSGIAGTSYRQLLKQSVTNQFVVGLTLIYSTAGATSQVFAPLTLTKSRGNGVADSSPIIPVPVPSQRMNNVTRVVTPFQIDGSTKITISTVSAATTVLFFFYPVAQTMPGNALSGGPTALGYTAPQNALGQ